MKISKFDAANYLKTPEAIAAYLSEAGDAAVISAALDTVARARGIANDQPASAPRSNSNGETI